LLDSFPDFCYHGSINKEVVRMMTLGERLTRLRNERGMSQDDLAEVLGVSRQSVSKWETDASVPELDKLVRLCSLFEVSLDELVRGVPPQAAPAAQETLWARLVRLYRERAYLLGWVLAAWGLWRGCAAADGISRSVQSGGWQFAASWLLFSAGYLLVIVLQLVTGLLVAVRGRRFSGRFRWYHLGWAFVAMAVFGVHRTVFLNMGILECALSALVWSFLDVKQPPQLFLPSLKSLLLLAAGVLLLIIGKRCTKRTPE